MARSLEFMPLNIVQQVRDALVYPKRVVWMHIAAQRMKHLTAIKAHMACLIPPPATQALVDAQIAALEVASKILIPNIRVTVSQAASGGLNKKMIQRAKLLPTSLRAQVLVLALDVMIHTWVR